MEQIEYKVDNPVVLFEKGKVPMSTRASKAFKVAGMEAPCEILLDRFVIAHIYARSRTDLFLAQGFNAARERLWQMDLWRKRGLGELAKDLGSDYLNQDRASRLLLYRECLDAEWSFAMSLKLPWY